MTKLPPKKRPVDPLDQIANANALSAQRVCEWCKPHFRARIEGRSSDHTRCDDFDCGCHCQDRLRVN